MALMHVPLNDANKIFKEKIGKSPKYFFKIQEDFENVEDDEDKIKHGGNTTKAIERRNADVEEVNRKLTNEGMQENITSKIFKPQSSAESVALETTTTSSSAQQAITHTTDTREIHSIMPNQNTAMSCNLYCFGENSNDHAINVTVSPNPLDISPGIDIKVRSKETKMLDVSCGIKAQEAEQYLFQADNKAKPDTSFVSNDQEQSNEAVNVTSKSLFVNEEFSDDRVKENLTAEDNISAKQTECQSGLSTYQQITESHDYKDMLIKKPLAFKDDRNYRKEELMIADNNVQSQKSEKQDELWRNFNNHTSISYLDRTETIETKTNSEVKTEKRSKILSSGESHNCKHTSQKDRFDSDHKVSGPIDQMAKYCEFSEENQGINDRDTKIRNQAGESEMFKETEENCIVYKSNQQGIKEEGTTKSHEKAQNTLEYVDEYFSDKVKENGGHNKAYIAISEGNKTTDDLYHANTYDTKLDSENKIEVGQNNIKTPSPMKRSRKIIKRPNRDGNKDNVSKGASLRGRNKEVSQTIINFGKRCESCLSTSFHNLNNNEIRCLNCFEFECILCEKQCSCGKTCYCKIIKKNIEEKLKQAKKILRESINGRLPIEDTIYIVSTHCYNLHNGKTTLTMDLRLSRHFESQHKNISVLPRGNLIEILVLDYEDPSSRMYLRSRQAVCVNLKTVVDEKVIGVYSKDMTVRKEGFLDPLARFLYSKDIQVQNVDAFSGQLGGKNAQLIVVCLLHSRVKSDVNADLCEIEEKLYKHIILVLLHFKKSDTRKCAHELKLDRQFSEMAIIDLFQRPENNNTDEVYEKIIDAINSYE
ncbi:uncharacterized protein LOC132738412 [Ruditapes philippinarum]|uniref:uncharacterized protein LOC132738412 n=1 Tax=Ruditapes philippinarum TaxID=129788 RepID=UPI00295C15E9|nr:uncharacterized protein LOC132738412 [Ruditapes philippinarum]